MLRVCQYLAVAGILLFSAAGHAQLAEQDSDENISSSSNDLPFPTTGTLTASQIENGVWWQPELDETSITLMLDNLRAWNVKNLYVDVFRSAETLFPSSVMPQRNDATDRDWLEYIIAQAHKHDIRVHAWVQVLCWQEYDAATVVPHNFLNSHPQWLDVKKDGVAFDGKTMARYVNPGVPEVRSVLLKLTDEICQYPLDGLNLDSVQYNYRADTGYNAMVMRTFRDETGIDAEDLKRDLDSDSDWMKWTTYREDQLTSLVQLMTAQCHRSGEQQNRRILVSVNVEPSYERSRGLNRRYQNWPQWVHENIVDFTLPECYSTDMPGLEKQLWQARSVHMGSTVACVPALKLSSIFDEAHPSFEDQERILHNTGFRHCNLMDYQAYLQDTRAPQLGARDDKKSFWDFFK